MFQKDRFLKIVFIILGLLYFSDLILKFAIFNFNQNLGYLDFQLFWQGLSDLSAGKIIYQDFYHEYGFLYLLLGQPIFILFGKTFFISVLISTLIYPTISIVLSFFIGKQFLGKRTLFLFLLLLYLYGINNDFTSLRHLIPELGLLTLILGIEKNEKKKIYLGSIFLGLSFLSSIEYAVAANISGLFYFFISYLKKLKLKTLFSSFGIVLGIESIIAVPYFIFLDKIQALKKMIVFLSEYANSFYYNSPCRDLFPRFMDTDKGINFYQRLNLYFVPILLIFLAIWILIKIRKHKWFSFLLTINVYTILIFYRTLNTPCPGYLNYGLTFLFFILLFLFSSSIISGKSRWILIIILFWFVILSLPTKINELIGEIKTFTTQDQSKKLFLPIAGIKLKKELTVEYQKVIDFVLNNSGKEDFIYVYPNGPYYQLTERKSAVSIASSWYYDLSPSLVKITLKQLEQKMPKLVIINIYNATSLKTNLNNLSYNVHSEKKEIIFEGITTSVENFIADNYEIAKKFKIAWVLKKKVISMPAKKLYLPINKRLNWKITGENSPIINLTLESFQDIDRIALPIKIDLGLAKIFSKYIIDIYLTMDDGQSYLITRQFATSFWQDVWIDLLRVNNKNLITGILVRVSDNKGFFWFGKPKNILLKTPQVFRRNPDLKIDESALKFY